MTEAELHSIISAEVVMDEELTGVYAARRFVVVQEGEVDEKVVWKNLRRLEDYLNRLIECKTLSRRDDVRRGIYTLSGKPLPLDAKLIIPEVAEHALPAILLCGFSRGDSGVIGYHLDLRELQELIDKVYPKRDQLEKAAQK